MARSTAMFALALTAMLAMGAGEKSQRAGDKGIAADAATNDRSAVEKALDKQVSLKLKDTPLKETAAYLADLSGVNVLLDSKALADAGIAQELPITLELANVSLGAALRAMLAEHDLGYTIPDDNVLTITTAQRAKEDVVVRVYDVKDLVSPAVSANEYSATPVGSDATSLIDLITTCVHPTSWTGSGAGSNGVISYAASGLVVSHNREVQREVAELLTSLRKIRASEKSGSPPTMLLLGSIPADDKIRERLEQRQDFDFDKIPLSEFISYLRAQGLPVSVNQKQIADSGGSLDMPLAFKAKQVSLKFALRTMLREHELGYEVRDGALGVTTDAAVKEHVRVGVYAVADLLDAKPSDAAHDLDFDSLIDLITTTVSPTSWSGSGAGQISPLANPVVLVLEQSDEIHEQIADMLAKMRAVKHSATEPATAKPHPEAKDAMVVRVHQVASKEDAALDQYIAVIRNLIWTDVGSYIGKAPGAIVVRHTPAVQQRIKNLLIEIDGSVAGAGGGGLGGGGAFQIALESTAAESPKSAPHAPGDKAGATPAAAEQTPVERALDKPTDFEFVETPLKDVAAALSKKSGINILLDEKAITDAGGAVDGPISQSLRRIPLGIALRLTLQEHDLNFLEFDDNVLLITSDAKAKESLVSRTYEVHDLAMPLRNGKGTVLPFDRLVDLLTTIVAPTSWVEQGGTGSIAIFENQLIITQTREIHERIIDLLAALRQARDEPEKYRAGGSGRPVSEAKVQELISRLPKPGNKRNESKAHGRIYPLPLLEAEIRKLVETPQDLDFHEMPLKDIVEDLWKFGLPVQMDAKAITEAGGTPDMPITFRAKSIRLETGLKLMLQAHELNFIIEDETLLITTDAKAKEHVVTRLYSVGDLVPDPSPDSSSDGVTDDNLIDIITTTVNPTSWDSAGGTGSLKPFPLVRALVCSQTQEAHEDIAKLLKMIRAQRTAKPAEESAQAKTKGVNVTRLYHLATADSDAVTEYLEVIKKLVEPSKYAYLGKVPGGIVAHCPPATHEQIKELLMKLEALPEAGDGANKGTARGRAGRNGPVGGGAF
jgi:hypothetical protein